MNMQRRRSRLSKNTFTTRSGNSFKIHRSLSEKIRSKRSANATKKAQRLSGLPAGRVKRFFYRLQPKRLYHYWFSREGGLMALRVLGISFIAGFILLVSLFAYFRKDLPNLRNITGDNIGGSIRYYDRTGKTLLWEDYDAVKRIPIEDKDIPQNIKNATVAIEDKDFFKHGGFDVRGIIRAGVNNTIGTGGKQGGSTLTQQLVKLTQNWSQERTVTRKIKEVILAVELERSYSKQEILTGYLNTAPYGGIEYGVEAASRNYFDKSAGQLTLDEAAMFAAIPKSPRYYSPYSQDFDKEAFIGRQHYVLDQMEQQGMITTKEKDDAKKIDTVTKVKPRKPKYDGIVAPWFVLAAKEQLETDTASESAKRGGWKVTTTLDMDKQKIAEEEVGKGIARVRAQGGDVAAFAAEDIKTGQMVALVGGIDFRNPDFGENNYARLRLPPGSSFKPYDYVSLIEHTSTAGAGSVLFDTQGPLEGYPCTNKGRPPSGNCLQNYDFRYPGPLTLRYALGGSRNVPAVKAMLTVGINKTIQTAESLGLKSGYKCYSDEILSKESECYASSAIGDGAYLRLDEHVHGYATLSRNGRWIPQTYILKIEGSDGKKRYEWKASKGNQVVRDEAAYIVADMLSDPKASYMSNKIHNYKGHKFSVKTGTTNDSKDGWMMGFSTQYAAGVWVGYHTRRIEMRGFMENMTSPIWNGFMKRAHDNIQPEERSRPAGLQTLPAYIVRSHVGVGSVEPSPEKDLFPSWYKNTNKQSTAKKTIDIVSNKLATDCTPERARKENTDSSADTFSTDKFVGTGGANTSENDDIHKCDDSKPTITLTVSSNGDGYDLSVSASKGTHPLSSEKFKGQIILSLDGQTIPGGEYSLTESDTATRTYSNYKPATSGTLTATIVDSVLYATADSKAVNASSGLQISSAKKIGSNYVFTWIGGTGTVTIYKSNGTSVCSSGAGTCSVGGGTVAVGDSVYAKAGASTSSNITITSGP